jgi:hypothetical protein
MEKVKFPILLTSFFVLFLNLFPFLGVPVAVIASMLMVAPLLTFWMVYKILRDAEPSQLTFDDQWYDDWDQNA